jgi:hypothetical protein
MHVNIKANCRIFRCTPLDWSPREARKFKVLSAAVVRFIELKDATPQELPQWGSVPLDPRGDRKPLEPSNNPYAYWDNPNGSQNWRQRLNTGV